jgi:hypothetical protein
MRRHFKEWTVGIWVVVLPQFYLRAVTLYPSPSHITSRSFVILFWYLLSGAVKLHAVTSRTSFSHSHCLGPVTHFRDMDLINEINH